MVRPNRTLRRVVALSAMIVSLIGLPTPAQDESNKASTAKATPDPDKALRSLQIRPGFQVDLFASEPLIANPVAFHVDEKGKFYVVETFRHSDGVTDTRNHMNWLNDDLASRKVADRVEMYRKFFSPKEFARYSQEEDRIRLVEDRDGDGKADHATVFADGFKLPETGLGAGVLSRDGDVYFTCIPDLWLLKDTNGDGKADEKKSLHTGYGVHVGFLGHDLHGLIFGPDGKLYFSIGDRGFNVRTWDGKILAVIDTGSVLRCEPDGSNLEVVATGLRNPQELAFNDMGDLFSVDNNSDGGDKARFVQIIEGADSGWRIGYQFIEKPNSRGIWNSEKMWHPAWDGQAAYLLPPLANFTDGPSGLTHYPGTGLNESQKDRFYISDFRGAASTSGIRSFLAKPKGPTYELTDAEQFLWGFEVTDCDFGPDGALYATDWIQGWDKTGKGRIWKVTAPEMKGNAQIEQTRMLIAEGMHDRDNESLANLLGHPDLRVRQSAQFELADRALSKDDARSKLAISTLKDVASKGPSSLAKVHGWRGLGQVLSKDEGDRLALGDLATIAGEAPDNEQDLAVLVNKIRALSKAKAELGSTFLPLLQNENSRLQMEGLLALARTNTTATSAPKITEFLATSGGRDPYLRHAAVMALTRIWTNAPDGSLALLPLANHASPNVRMAILLVMRRVAYQGITQFLEDSDPTIVLEAARAIAELPEFSSQVEKLAELANKPIASESLARRVVAACEMTADARGLVQIASRSDVPEAVRVEALVLLAEWKHPSPRHPVSGLAREVKPRPTEEAVTALLPALPQLVSAAPEKVRKATVQAAGKLGLKDAGPALRALASDASRPADSRVEALRALLALNDENLVEVAQAVAKDSDPGVRVEAVRVISKTNPDQAVETIQEVLKSGPIAEKQGAFATLAEIASPKADALLNQWLDRLVSGEVAPEVRLDLTEAATQRDLKDKLARYESSASNADPLSVYRDTLTGGDASRGRRIFREKAEVQCLRCHKVEGDGGEVGPELTGILAKHDRAYILESIILPNKQIAEGFETQLIARSDGQIISGIVKSETDDEVRLMTAEGKLLTIPKSEIEDKARGNTAMPEDIVKSLKKSEIRDLIEFLATTKAQ